MYELIENLNLRLLAELLLKRVLFNFKSTRSLSYTCVYLSAVKADIQESQNLLRIVINLVPMLSYYYCMIPFGSCKNMSQLPNNKNIL
jgi:hypothetical protein